MRKENVCFYSEGYKVHGTLYLPEGDGGKPWPGIVQGPGFLGLKDARHYILMFERLCDAGYACLCFDYRGWGQSEGPQKGWVMPAWQAEDIRNAITYMETRDDVDSDRIATYGSGGTGGGNAVLVGAADSRVKCVVCYLGVCSGRDWLHSMRREYEWIDYLGRIEEDRRQRVLTGSGALVPAREEIMVQTPERVTTSIKKEVAASIPDQMPLQCADAILDYAPEDVVHKIAPRGVLFIAVENDATTPEEHSIRMYEKAGEPKKLVMLRKTTHYGVYNDYFDQIAGEVVDWYNRHLRYDRIAVTES